MRLPRPRSRCSVTLVILLALAGPVRAQDDPGEAEDTAADEASADADAGAAGAPTGAPQADRSPRYEIAVEGMRCAFCAFGLERKLRTLDGVQEVQVRLRDARAVVLLAPDASLPPDAVARVVEEAGFEMKALEMRVRGLVRGSGDRLTFVLGRERFGLREGGGFAGLRELVETGTRDVMLTAHVHRGEGEDAKTTLAVVAANAAEPKPPEERD